MSKQLLSLHLLPNVCSSTQNIKKLKYNAEGRIKQCIYITEEKSFATGL